MQAVESIRSEMMDAVRAAGYRLAPDASIKARRNAVARATRLSGAVVDRIWYGNVVRIDAAVADTIRNLTATNKTVGHSQQITAELINEIAEIRERLERLMDRLGNGENVRT